MLDMYVIAFWFLNSFSTKNVFIIMYYFQKHSIESMDANWDKKIVKVMRNLLDPNYQIRSDIYLNQLLKFLTEEFEGI